MKKIAVFMTAVAMLILSGCNEMGKVVQGRVIAFDKDAKKVTFIEDKTAIPGKPDYTVLPPSVFTTPKDPNEMGPAPKVGQRLKLDTDKNIITIFDMASQQIKEIPYTPVDKKEKVKKDSPLVKDKKFPVVDKNAKTIEIYSKRQELLVKLSLPEEYFTMKDETWDAGDEVRIYYREAGKAERLMNVSKTDIFKK